MAFNIKDKLKNFMGSSIKGKDQDLDINIQIRQLDERKVKLTFKDIWKDY